ncbi:MAG: response regulator transcription factor [Rubrivivax sp.]|nr:response regulator transcription factor [Rubrivivax sp.]
MRVLMLDDHVMFLQGLKNLLAVLAPELQVDTSPRLAEALQLAQLTAYDLVLLDWHLAEHEGAQSLEKLREAGCTARVVVLSGETGSALIRRSVELGAAGFIPKTYSSEMMIAALRQVLAGRIYLPAQGLADAGAGARGAARPASIEADPRFAGLTPRQIEVYLDAARGLPNKLIARRLGIAESTVKTHLTAVFAALGVRNRTEAAYQASREGLRIA